MEQDVSCIMSVALYELEFGIKIMQIKKEGIHIK